MTFVSANTKTTTALISGGKPCTKRRKQKM